MSDDLATKLTVSVHPDLHQGKSITESQVSPVIPALPCQ